MSHLSEARPSERKIRILALVPPEESISRLAPFFSRSQMEIVQAKSGFIDAILLQGRRKAEDYPFSL